MAICLFKTTWVRDPKQDPEPLNSGQHPDQAHEGHCTATYNGHVLGVAVELAVVPVVVKVAEAVVVAIVTEAVVVVIVVVEAIMEAGPEVLAVKVLMLPLHLRLLLLEPVGLSKAFNVLSTSLAQKPLGHRNQVLSSVVVKGPKLHVSALGPFIGQGLCGRQLLDSHRDVATQRSEPLPAAERQEQAPHGVNGPGFSSLNAAAALVRLICPRLTARAATSKPSPKSSRTVLRRGTRGRMEYLGLPASSQQKKRALQAFADTIALIGAWPRRLVQHLGLENGSNSLCAFV